MTNSYPNRTSSLSGPASDVQPVVPDDNTDLPTAAIALYVESGGTVSFVTIGGEERQVALPDFAVFPVRVRRVRATGTTAAGIHAMVLA
jgi:hypothetical protein